MGEQAWAEGLIRSGKVADYLREVTASPDAAGVGVMVMQEGDTARMVTMARDLLLAAARVMPAFRALELGEASITDAPASMVPVLFVGVDGWIGVTHLASGLQPNVGGIGLG